MKILIFTEASCEPCKQLRELGERFAKRYGFDFEVIRAETDRDAFLKWGISGVPAVVIADGETRRGWFMGAQSETSFESKLRKFGVIE